MAASAPSSAPTAFCSSEGMAVGVAVGKGVGVFVGGRAACCQQGVEFKFDFGTDFPQQNDEIIVTGTYKVVYDENDIMRTFLQAEEVIFNK